MTLESRLDQLSRGWRGPLLAAVVALIAGLPGLLAVPPLDRDESRFAQATAQMLESDDYVSINYQDQPRDKKPVGIHWLQAISVAALSDSADRDIWPYRIPSLLGAMLAAAACAWGAAGFFGGRTGLLAGAMLGASFLLSTEAGIAKTDAVLAGATVLALAAMGRIYHASRGGPAIGWRTQLLFWLGIGLATLVKGPVGPLVALLTGLALWASDRRIDWAKSLGAGWGLVLVLAIVGPWAWAITVASDGAFWGAAIGGDLAPKLAGGHERHGGLPGYHLLLSPMLLFPASLLLPAGLILGWKARAEPGVRFALCWLIPTWLMFELLPTKLAHYSLPALGGLCWLMAASLREPLGRVSRLTGMVVLAFASLVFAAISIAALSQYGDNSDLTWATITAGLFLLTGLVAGLLLVRQATWAAVATAGIGGVLAHAAFFGQLAPRLEPLWLSQRVAMAMTSTGLAPREGVAPGPVEVAGYAEPSLVFALGTRTGLGGPDEAVAAIAAGRPAVVEAREAARFKAAMAAAGLSPRPAGTISGVDYSNGDEMKLTLYRGEPQAEPARRVRP
ncbi:MAG: glycosyltransferase family 39 protein [Caulobacter sp.]|nr:glycosyltransferase family 39 protein [Caulobacter sp.]